MRSIIIPQQTVAMVKHDYPFKADIKDRRVEAQHSLHGLVDVYPPATEREPQTALVHIRT